MTGRGPLVHRSVHTGAIFYIVAAAQFILAMIVVGLRYPGYSISGNPISDLGGPNSPLPYIFNASAILFGILAFLGTVLIRSAFPPRPSRGLGLLLFLIGSIAVVLVGVFPEGSSQLGGNIHGYVASTAFLAGGLALPILALAMRRDTRWGGYRLYTAISGLVSLIATGLYASGTYLSLGPGGTERLIVAPILLWGIVAGIHLARLPTYAPPKSVVASPA